MAGYMQALHLRWASYIVITLSVITRISHGSTCTSSYAYMQSDTESDRDMMLDNHLARNITGVRSPGECLTICLRHGTECQSINFASDLQLCHVNDATKSSYAGDFVSSDGFNYYEPSSSSHWLVSILYHTLDYLCKLWQSLLLLKSHLIYYLIDGLLDLYHTTNTLCLQLLAETEGLCHSYYVNSVCPWRSSGCIIFFYNGSVVPFLISYVFSLLPNKTIITSSCQVNSVIIRLN